MGNVEIPKWLKDLPLAPEFRPTDTEFADPIAYISKIEKEASAFGICKIIPPLPKPSKRYVFFNLNKSLSRCPELGDVDLSNASSSMNTGLADCGNEGGVRAVFTTRHQELGQGMKRTKGMVKEGTQLSVHKQVWQSGEVYTLEQFESKSKAFARSLLGMIKEVNPLVIEALFWKAASEKPIHVEYANDVPGSAFGEPEGQFRYFHRRRRKRASYKSYRRSTESSDCQKKEMDNVNNSCNDEIKDATCKNDPSTSSGPISRSSITSSTSSLEDNLRSSKRKNVNAITDVEGTAGWKLSNSPWNLQVIARSPGSITRFMPDDIPGVTSPMIYIGMLFSWFAWHVEDHELHSMNFLHTGSPKTWYAVPGDYAFAFEEVIRTEAYGGSIDRLGALTLLGEKTTLLSPEVVVSASIPCCRLIQNPGEFVVTFPRAYHVGFSHGFNCGEAANFGTPQWLQVAKEAAVRRAAMNYLPMLSHQQLLYLLTMSFVSRVPRSLLPGARSSRLRDRLKEERELSVKRAFIQDMLKENSILSALLGKDSTYNVVIWNPDLLPCASKESQLPNSVATIAEENVLHTHSEDKSNATGNDLLKEMSLYMESLNDLYVDDDDDLSCDFQVDSGTLACVACGILGFPFMCVVQPSERASIELLQGDHPLVQEGSRIEKFDNCHSSAACDGSIKCSVPDNLHPVSDLFLPLTNLPMPRGWNNSSKFLRPRIFCLEHGVQIEEMLQSKGGANMLVICHSDYQKIKAHAAAISEDIGTPFNYNEVLLESASQEDLNLICLAIDNEDHDESGQEWTSKMGINLRFCLKVRKNAPSSKAQHALALGGLFSDGSSSDFLNIKWQSRRSRSRTKLNWPAHYKPCQNVEPNKNDALGKRSGRVNIEKGQKLIQYTRRKYKVKIDCSSNWSQCCPGNHVVEEVSVANCEDLVKHTGKTCKIGPTVETSGRDSAGFDFSPLGTSGVLHEVKVLEATGNMSLNSAPLHVAGSLLTANVAVEHTEKVENQTLEESNGYEIVCNTAACGNLEMQHKEKVTGGTSEVEDSNAIECRSPCVVTDDKRSRVQEEYQIMEKNNLRNETYNMVSEGQHKFLASRDVLENEVTDLATASSVHACAPVGQMENLVVEQSSMNCEVCDCATLDNEVQVALQTTGKSTGSRSILYDDTPVNQLSASVEERAEFSQGTCFSKDKCYGFNKLQHEVQFTGRTNVEELIPINARLVNHPNQVSEDEFSEIFRDPCDPVKLWDGATSENVVQQAIQATNESKAEHISFSVAQMEIDQPTIASMEGFPEVIGRITASKDLCTTTMSSSDSKKVLKIPTANTSSVEELVLHSPTQMQDTSNMEDPAGEYSEAPREKYASEDTVGVNLDTEVQQEIHSDDGMNKDDEGPQICETTSASDKEEHLSGRVTQINQCNPDPFTKCSTTDEESCTEENMLKGQEVCSSCEQESIKSTVVEPGSTAGKGRKRKNEVDQLTDKKLNCNGFIKGPCEGLRPRARKDGRSRNGINIRKSALDNPPRKKARKPSDVSVPCTNKEEITKRSHKCDLEGCTMSFETKAELQLHKRNQCPYEGCRKRFSTHKYAIIHQRVHEGDRPLKCPWNGCSMSFKWAWARTEHIRVHTGEKPYKCKVEGCGLSFRFVSDFSRHRRKTGHYVNTPA